MQANPLSTSVARDVPHRAGPQGLEAQPRHDRLRGVHACSRTPTAPRCAWPTPTASTPAAAGGAAARPLGDPRPPAGLRGRPVAHRQPGQRAGGADLVLRPQLRPVQPLLLRPDRARAAARPGLHPARRADRHEPRPRPARRPGFERWPRSAARRCPRAPTSTSRSSSPRAAWPRCRCRASVLRASAERARVAPSTSSRGRCARCPGIERVRITVGGAPGPAVAAAGSTPRSRAAPSSTPPAPPTAELWGLRGGRVVDLRSAAAGRRRPDRSAGPATRCAASR